MSQQAAIQAEKQRRAEQRLKLRQQWISRIKRWGVLGVGALVLLLGIGSWVTAGLGAQGDLDRIATATAERTAETEELQDELDQAWSTVVASSSGIDPAKVAADEESLQALMREVADRMSGDPRGKAADLGIEADSEFVTAFLLEADAHLGDLQVPAVHEINTSLVSREGGLYNYVAVVWFTDASDIPIGQPGAEEITPAPENSEWAVVFFSTTQDGKFNKITAQWVETPPLGS